MGWWGSSSSSGSSGSSSGGWWANKSPSTGGGGGHHGLIGSVVHDVEHGAHWTAAKAGLAAQDVKSIPGGIVQAGKAFGHDVAVSVEHPERPIGPSWGQITSHPLRASNAHGSQLYPVATASVKQTGESFQHPLRDPFQTVLNAAAAVSAGAGVAARAGAAADALRAGDVAGAARGVVAKPGVSPRLLRSGEGKVSLHPSRNPAVRAVQGGYDKVLQRSLDTNPEGRIAAHANRRIHGSIAETTRFTQRMRSAIADDLERAGRKVGNRKLAQAALRLTSENSTPEEAAAFHRAQAAKGIEPKRNAALATLYGKVAEQRLLTTDTRGSVAVDAQRFPELAQLDAKLAGGQTRVDEILREYGLMTDEGLAARRDLPGQIRRAGATEPEPVFRTTPSGKAKLASFTSPVPERSVYGPQGRGYVPYKITEPKASRSPVASSTGPVVGAPRSFVTSHEFTGAGLEKGMVPDNTTGLFARHMRRALRFVSTDEFRRAALETGSKVRRSSRDVLVRVPGEKAGQIPLDLESTLGRKRVNLDELHGHEQAVSGFLDQLIPGRGDNFATDRAQAIGTAAPAGYRWVDRNVLGDQATFRSRPRGKIARKVDAVNSAITAATVYFKIGHIGTRVLTNAATTIIQGSAAPRELARSVKLWNALPWPDRLRALAAAGQHGFAAMPHEGEGLTGRIAGRGAQFWARHADAPFRFASIAYEARRAGYRTPAAFQQFLDRLENVDQLAPAERAHVEVVAKEANRAGIAYDRLNDLERNYISRAVWFYPWVKGSTAFAGRTVLEHPLKSAALGAAGVQGRETQQALLGDLPSYEQGLFQLAGGASPLVSDFSTFSPFATPADVVQALARPAGLAGFLNPAVGAGSQLIHGLNQYGSQSKSPYLDALLALGSPTPEQQVATAYANRGKDQSGRMFHTTPGSALLRFLVGPGMPRRINLSAAHKAAARERSGR